ncbi:phosphatidate cytidylyltransferase [Luteimicrobium subarcticum]|uniref:Phosphatidate cytidylyltransferase n=1 Tax=Luteimicrobium subarcticum TaxID=620910 RepID=A0A2M8WV43_9MICO|nr:phosphatidate cytidylyltransferase [Luteimicrobium subarcticum]PJI94788.1 phosphatidate cytidylyltransferase [Luteimicrobium subarcticum]
MRRAVDPLGALGLDRDAFSLRFDVGSLHVDLEGRAVFFLLVSVVVLAVAAVPVLVSGRPELRARWTTWAFVLPVLGIPLWLGSWSTALFAAAVAVVCVLEFARLADLPRPDVVVLLVLAVAYPLAAWLEPRALALVPVLALACAAPSLAAGDVEHGLRRSASTAFGSIWICWSLANLVLLGNQAFLVCFAAAATDVAAWCGGNGLRRLRWARRPLSPLSPSKTVGGLVGAAVGAALVLLLLGGFTAGLLVAVVVGAVGGDLVESMVKRQAGVKDAGSWLPGFGGLLDRVDSLLLVLPLAVVLS